MIGVQFTKDNTTHEVLTAPILDAKGDLIVVTVMQVSGEVCIVKVTDIEKLNRPPMPKLDS